MSDLFKKAISLGVGLTIVSKEKVEKVVDDLVKRGELAPSESKALVDRLIERGDEERGAFKSVVQEQVQRVLKELKVPVQADIATLACPERGSPGAMPLPARLHGSPARDRKSVV